MSVLSSSPENQAGKERLAVQVFIRFIRKPTLLLWVAENRFKVSRKEERQGTGKCVEDARKSNFTAKCLNTFVARHPQCQQLAAVSSYLGFVSTAQLKALWITDSYSVAIYVFLEIEYYICFLLSFPATPRGLHQIQTAFSFKQSNTTCKQQLVSSVSGQ